MQCTGIGRVRGSGHMIYFCCRRHEAFERNSFVQVIRILSWLAVKAPTWTHGSTIRAENEHFSCWMECFLLFARTLTHITYKTIKIHSDNHKTGNKRSKKIAKQTQRNRQIKSWKGQSYINSFFIRFTFCVVCVVSFTGC